MAADSPQAPGQVRQGNIPPLRDVLAALPPVEPAERVSVEEMFEDVAHEVSRWSRGFPALDRKLLPAMVVFAALLTPKSTRQAIVARAKLSLWVAAIDELFERPDTEFRKLEAIICDCLPVVADGAGALPLRRTGRNHADALAGAVKHIVELPGWQMLRSSWSVLLARLLDGMAFEYFLERRCLGVGFPRPIPSFDEYLFHGRHTVSAPLVWSTALAEVVPPLDSMSLRRYLAVLERCGAVLRLANDLAAPDETSPEGRLSAVRLSALGAQACNPMITWSDAVSIGRNAAKNALSSEKRSLRRLVGKNGDPIADRFLRMTEFISSIYAKRDVRELARSLAQDATGE